MADHVLLCVGERSRRRAGHPHVRVLRVKNLETSAVDELTLYDVSDAMFAGNRFFVMLSGEEPVAAELRTCVCGEGDLYATGPGGNVVDRLPGCS